MVDSLPIGSAAWTGGDEYQDEYSERIKNFIGKIDQAALLEYASRIREGRSCTLSQEFSVGSFNLVRKIQFDDGIEWIARLRMPQLPVSNDQVVSSAEDAVRAQPHILYGMESELATMEFVRQSTSIPVPKVYAYDLRNENDVGCPFTIMDYISGNTAEEVSRTYPGEHEGVPAQFEKKFYRQFASIMTQLASVRMPKIGSITRNSTAPDVFEIGPLVETGSGPYDSAADFYADYPLALSKSLSKPKSEPPVAGQEELVQAFISLAETFSTETPRSSLEGFGLANYDLNPNNILVDRDFNILAVIDWDSVVAVPDAALYRFPFLMGVACAVPGVVETHPAKLERQKRGQLFATIVEMVGQQHRLNSADIARSHRHFLPKNADFYSKEAVAFQSLVYVKMKQDWVNEMWLQGLKWLREHSKAEVAEFYSQTQHRPHG